MISLNKAVPEKTYFFVGISTDSLFEKHLTDLGFVRGKELRILSTNSTGNLIVQVQESRIALTRELCEAIIIEEKQGNETANYVSLGSLPVGSSRMVAGFLGKGQIRRRLMDMGITRGVEISLRKRAPLGDPLEITLRGYELTLRKAEADLVLVYEDEA